MKIDENFSQCDRCKRTFRSISVAHCRHPTVNQHIGNHICIYCCMKCKHHKKMPNCGAIGCNLTLNNGGDNNG